VLLSAAALGVLIVAAWGVALPEPNTWFGLSAPASNAATIPWTPEPLPLPQASESQLARARALMTTGRLRDALVILERVPVGDPLRFEADRLRADLQQQLLSLATEERPHE
jgi:hypothetical protein